jgi:nitrite reductase/ring-hydroxylating ferredoxin subunit
MEVFGTRMALARVGEDFFALQGKCPHGPGQLGDGDLDGHLVTCPVHGLSFDVRDGTCSSDPDMVSPTIPVKVKGERVFVMV